MFSAWHTCFTHTFSFSEAHADDWKCDQYRWRHYGRKKLQTTPVVFKTYYVFVQADGTEEPKFKRNVYMFSESYNNRAIVIHYKGDDTVISNVKPHVRTCPSVLRELERTEVPPSVAYKRKVATSVPSYEHQSVQLPRNRKQVKNLQSRFRQRLRISHDALYNLHELSFDLHHFVHKVITYPDLVVICGLKQMLAEVNRLLQLESSLQLMSYDTTFKLGDFYVSPLLFRNVLFRKSPVMPAMFMLHERKLRSTHDELMRVVASELSCLVSGKYMVPLVTDEEKGFEVIDDHLPKIRRFFCWNHIINAAKIWLKRHGASASEIPVYVSNMRELFHQETEEKYVICLNQVKLNWSEPFVHYFLTELHNKVA